MQKIATALVKAQKQFAPAIKSSTNPHFKSKYADLATCIEAVLDALNDNGIALIQQTHPAEQGITVETMFIHESGESLSGGQLTFPASKLDPQGYMSALTYARRGSLMAACGIAPEDDDGNDASRRPMPRPMLVKKPRGKEEIDGLLTASKSLTELQLVWATLTPDEQTGSMETKNKLKKELT